MKKICLLGDGAVGKTSLIRRFVYDEFSDDYLSTFGTKVTKKVVDPGGGKNVALLIWDILGQKKHERLHSTYYRGASGALVVCDVTRKDTFTTLPRWIDSFHSVVSGAPVVVLGNKVDLEDQIVVGEKAIKKFASSVGVPYYMTSAKTGLNVEEAFRTIAKLSLGYTP